MASHVPGLPHGPLPNRRSGISRRGAAAAGGTRRGIAWRALLGLAALSLAPLGGALAQQGQGQTPPQARPPVQPQPQHQPQSQPQPPAAPDKPAPSGTITRAITLRELGLGNGIAFAGLSGQRELFFPVPRQGLQSALLRLRLRSGAAFQAQRYLQISAGGSILVSRAVASGEAGEPIAVPIEPRLAQDGFFRVALRYSGAMQADRCLDERVAGDFAEILPDASLEMRFTPAAFTELRAVAALLPREVTVVLPGRELQRSEIASAVRLAAFLKRRGAVLTLATPKTLPPSMPGVWSRGLVLIGQAQDFPELIGAAQPAADGLSVIATASGPALLMSGENAASAISILNSQFRVLADNPTLSVNQLADMGGGGRAMTFEELGLAARDGELDERVQFDVPFASDRLPRDASLEGVKLELAIGAAPSDANADASIFAFLNGRLLGSRRASGAVPTTLSLSVPDGLVGRDNMLSVRIQRPPRVGACANPGPGQPVQLLPSSSLQFAAASLDARQFYELPQLFRSGVDIVLPADPTRLAEALPHLLTTAADLLPDDAPLAIRKEARPAAGDKPFIIVSRGEPADSEPRLRFDQGALTISRGDGKPLIDLANGDEAPTIAQVLRAPKATGLWLRPGNTLPEPEAAGGRLDRGDVAVIDKAGIALAFSTEQKQTVTIAYQDIRSWGDRAAEYRPWIVGALWIALTALFIRTLSRMYRSRSE